MSSALPSPHVPLTDKETGQITDVWYRYLSQVLASVTSLEGVTPLTSITYATKADEEAGASSTAVVAPSVQQYHPSAAKAWGVWDITTAGAASLSTGYNISTFAYSTGAMTVTLAVPFASTNYVISGSVLNASTHAGFAFFMPAAGRGVSTFTVQAVATTTNGLIAASKMEFICYGDQ